MLAQNNTIPLLEAEKYQVEALTRPNGPILGANDEVAPTSPPTHRKYTMKHKKYKSGYRTNFDQIIRSERIPCLTSVGSNFGGIFI